MSSQSTTLHQGKQSTAKDIAQRPRKTRKLQRSPKAVFFLLPLTRRRSCSIELPPRDLSMACAAGLGPHTPAVARTARLSGKKHPSADPTRWCPSSSLRGGSAGAKTGAPALTTPSLTTQQRREDLQRRAAKPHLPCKFIWHKQAPVHPPTKPEGYSMDSPAPEHRRNGEQPERPLFQTAASPPPLWRRRPEPKPAKTGTKAIPPASPGSGPPRGT